MIISLPFITDNNSSTDIMEESVGPNCYSIHNSKTNTVATEKSIYQEYMERTLFHSELWGIFLIKFFPEADNKISTSPEIVHVNFPINIGKIYMEKSDLFGYDLTTFRLPLVAFIHSAMTPLGYPNKIYVYIYFKT